MMIIEEIREHYRNNKSEQIDDVCLIGVRV